jgi:hypothetical protein
MNCDQVFDVLTRGPFPTGHPSDAAVEAHLDECADCWQIAEALRPAVDVFQESIPPAESRELPGYWGSNRPAASLLAELAARSTQTALAAGIQREAYGRPRQQFLEERANMGGFLRIVVILASLAAVAASLVIWLRG